MWRKIVFSISAIAILSMASVVGPSSAVLMIPRPDMTHVRSAETYDTNVPESLVFPTRLDSSQNMSFSKFDYLERIRPYEDGYVWQLGVNQRRRPIDELVMSTSGLPSYSENSYIVSLPTNLAGDQALEKFMQSLWIGTNDEVSAVINTYQPLVSYICHEFDSSRDGWTYYTMRNGSVDRLKPISELNMQFMRYEGYLYAAPIWIAAPDNPASLIVVLAGKYEESSSYFGSICTISSYWWHTDAFLKVIPDPPRFRLSVKRPDPDLTDTGATRMTSNLRPITVDASNIESLNSVDLTYKIQSNLDFAFLWVAALAQVPRQQPGEIRDTISDGKSHMSDSQDNASNASYTVTTLFHGFGYGSTDTPSKLSAAVITAYCLISLLFVAYIITTGHTSIAWDSAMELIVLALQSKEPDSLGHISVGLDSMDTFRKTVGIRVNTVPVGDTGETRERLELIFEHDEDTEKRGLTEVVRNRAY